MNKFIAQVTEIKNCDNLHIVKFTSFEEELSMMSLDINENIGVGTNVELIVKPTHVAIAKDFSGEVSYSNQLPCIVVTIDNGELLSSLKLDFHGIILESIITLNAVNRMELRVGESVTAFIKASDLSIGEVIDV